MAEALTAPVLLSSVILLLLLQPQLSFASHNLTCVNDYINNITCIWHNSWAWPGVACTLQGTKAEKMRTCTLEPLNGPEDTLQGCHLIFEHINFNVLDKIPLTVKCGSFAVEGWKEYKPSMFIKMHPPDRIGVNHTNISWGPGSPFSKRIFTYRFQVQFKLQTQQWEDAKVINVRNNQNWSNLNAENLEKGEVYQARVRVIPDNEGLAGEWSDWSPVFTWTSLVGMRFRVKELESGEDWMWLTVGTLVSLTCLVPILLVCTVCRDKWLYKVKFQHIPDPSKYFDALNSTHGGNFQEWLRPTFTPHSFDIHQFSEDISAVEVSTVKDTAPLTCLDYSSLAEQWESSGQSFYSNMGYFYSKYPSSYEIEPCSLYFSYQPGEGLCGRDKNTHGTVNQGPLQPSSSYERLEHLGKSSGQPDSGFGMAYDDQGMAEEEEDRVKGEEEAEGMFTGPAEHRSPPALSFQTSCHPFLPHYPQSLHSFPQLLLPISRFGLNGLSCPNPTLEQLGGPPGRSTSLKIEPSSGGYMSLQDMQGNDSNKSV